jgi:transposase
VLQLVAGGVEMGSPRKRYSREFKIETVRKILETGQSQAEVARELDISANTVCRWKQQYQVEQKEAFPGTGRQTSSAALVSRLRRENERLRQERDFLKKTAIYFAHENESGSE